MLEFRKVGHKLPQPKFGLCQSEVGFELELVRRVEAEFTDCINEYFELGHTELVLVLELHKPHEEMYYMPMHAVQKESSTTTKLRVVLDASAKTASGA